MDDKKYSLCMFCKNCFDIHIENVPNCGGDKREVVCLIYPKIFDDAVKGMYEGRYPKVVSCSKFESM